MKGKNVFYAVHTVFCCIAVNALVDDVVGIPAAVQVALQIVWIGLACGDAMAGGK
jgi:hypothetical protein